MDFTAWIYDDKTMQKALGLNVTYKPEQLSTDPYQCAASFPRTNSNKNPYQTTLISCQCESFKRLPSANHVCKHMLRLAMDAGFIKKPAYTPAPKKEPVDRSLGLSNTFGCCNAFHQCSDLGHCIFPPESDFSKGCLYNANLQKGRIFYGKNQNYPPLQTPEILPAVGFQEFCALAACAAVGPGQVQIIIRHQNLGDIPCHFLHCRTLNGQHCATLCSASALPCALPFDVPKDKEPDHLPSNRVSYPGDSALYGCNSWFRSDLRRYLNSSAPDEPCCNANGGSLPGFLSGLDEEVLSRLVPTEILTYAGQIPTPIDPLYTVPPYSVYSTFFQAHDIKKDHRFYIIKTVDRVWIPAAADFGFQCAMLKTLMKHGITESRFLSKPYLKANRPTNLRLRDASLFSTANYLTALCTDGGTLRDCNAASPVNFSIMFNVQL